MTPLPGVTYGAAAARRGARTVSRAAPPRDPAPDALLRRSSESWPGAQNGMPVGDAADARATAHAPDAISGATPLISVVVPTYRRPMMLDRCLDALLAQRLSPNDFEIIVCDDGPDEGTRETVERHAAERAFSGPVIRYLPITATQGPAGARNAGWRGARADIVAFTDDDTLPARDWLAAGLTAMAGAAGDLGKPSQLAVVEQLGHDSDAVAADATARPIAAASGCIDVPLGPRPTDYERDAAGLARAEFATANCFVRRETLQRTGGFDERYTSAWREDSDLQFRILANGGRIVRAAAAVVVHPVRPARWGVSVSQQRKSQFDALLYKNHPLLFRERIGAAAPWLYYLTVTAFCVGIGEWLAGAPYLAAGALTLWLLLTVRFAAQRLMRTSHAPSHIAEMLWTSIVIPPLSIYWRIYGACKFRVPFL
ncbi:MAG: glycosyltransferase family 2 protein [Janthinobacterium lividum]